MKNFLNKELLIKLLWLFFYIFVFTYILQFSFANLDPDLGWHLQFGKEIIEQKDVPRIETHNYPLEGKKWVDHEWLTNLISYTIYSNFNFVTLTIFFTLITIITLYAINHILLKQYSKQFAIPLILFELLGIYASSVYLGIRMQVITQLFLVLLLITINKYLKTKNLRYLLLLLPMFYFWTNLHGGFLIGYFILGLCIAVLTTTLVIKNFSIFNFFKFPNINKKEIIVITFISFLAFLVSLITPYRTELYSFLYYYKNTFYLTHIYEWLPSYYWPLPYPQLLYQAIITTFFTINLVYTITDKAFKRLNKKNRINFWHFSLFIIFLLLSFKSRRHFPLFFIASLPFLVDFLKSQANEIKINKQFKKILYYIFIITFLIFSIHKISNTYFTNQPFTNDLACNYYPCEAVELLKSDPKYLNKQFFNDYTWGGYFVYTWPEKQIFLDGRLPIYSYKNHSIYEEYFEFFDEDKIEEKLEEYNIEMVLTRNPGVIKFSKFETTVLGLKQEEVKPDVNYLKEYLEESNEWEIIYSDNKALIFVKI